MDQRHHVSPRLQLAPVLAALLLIGALSGPGSARAQQARGLEGTELQPIATLDQEVGNLLGDLLNTKPDGEIRSAVVKRERAASLTLDVEYEGFDGNWLKGQALRAGSGGDPEVITEVVAAPVELDGSGRASIEFTLAGNVSEGASFESSHLTLIVARRASHRTGATSTFVLSKQWEAATRAENVEITVHARALQDLTTGYAPAPEPGARPSTGPSDDEVSVEHVRLRIGQQGSFEYLSADDGGGGRVRLQSDAGDAETFELGWIDEEAKIGRLRAANGWHLVALHPDGRVDAASADPADPATVLHFKYNGDGTYIVQAADAATTRRVTGAAEASRLRILARPQAADLIRRPVVRTPVQPNLRPNLNRPGNLSSGSAGAAPLTIYHGSGTVSARPYDGTARGAAFYFVRNAPIPRLEGRPGEGEGPARDPIMDLEVVPVMQGYISGRSADDGPRIEDLLGIDSQIWADVNAASGIYYYVPAGYHLRWDPDNGYDMSLTSEMMTGDTDPHVLVRARLGPRFTPAQRRAAEILVRQGARGIGRPFFDLRPMPIADEATTSTAAEALAGHHRIENVTIHAPSDPMGEVELSWQMPAVTQETFVELLRRGQAVTPQLVLQPGSGEAGTHRVPLHLSWDYPASYPAILWENGSFKRNEAPHPIRLNGLHAMVLDRDERVQVVSWDLSGTAPVPPRARIAMGNPLTRPVIDNAFFTWVDYSILPDDASIEAAVRTLIGGVSEQVRQPLVITLFDPLAASGARQVTVFVRSRYFEAAADEVIARQFVFDEDGATRSVPFYLGRADVDVPFEWTVRLTMPDGEVHERPVFLEGDTGLQLLVSSASLREIFGDLPPGEPDS